MADDESNQRRKVKFLQILLMDSFEEEDVLRGRERVIWTRSWIRRTKLEREITKFSLVYKTWTTTANVWYFHLELNAVVAYLTYICTILERLANYRDLDKRELR